ncbi:MAG: hypothetical protein ACREUV_00595 [Burkholderiales bacterium]
MLAKLNVVPNLAVALILAVLAFKLGAVKVDWMKHVAPAAQEQTDCERLTR